MKRIYNLLLLCAMTALSFSPNVINAQTLQDQFKTYYEEASNWEDYKVIKANEVNRFWKVVSDSLKKKDATIKDADARIIALEQKIDVLNAQFAETQAQLENSEKHNSSIYFLGIPFSKSAYHVMVWLIILGTLIVAGFAYVLYMRSNSLTKSTQRNYDGLKDEFDEFRDESKQKQLLMKRDIQTMLNTLEENNIKVSSMVGYRDSIKL